MLCHLLASVGKLILNYNSGNLLWCTRELAAKDLMLLHYFVCCVLSNNSSIFPAPVEVSAAKHDIAHWGVYITVFFNFQLQELDHVNQSECRIQKFCTVIGWHVLTLSIVEEVVVSSSTAGSYGFSLSIPTACCFQSPSVVVLITGLPDNLRWPPHHFTHTTAVIEALT